jgi:uncharacterized glyoxalase superfamily protein PhnB
VTEQRVVPMLSYEDVGRAADWIVDGVFVEVDDIDAHYERARAAAATILSELENNPGVGQRQYRAEDIEGHRWMFAKPT